jgi:hypothetical protein
MNMPRERQRETPQIPNPVYIVRAALDDAMTAAIYDRHEEQMELQGQTPEPEPVATYA